MRPTRLTTRPTPRLTALLIALALVATAGPVGCAKSAPRPAPGTPVYVLMRTTEGDMTFELDRANAPVTVRNFLTYADAGGYEGTIFHRVVRDFVIQGGGCDRDLRELPHGPPIRNEWTNTLKNVRGTIGMARDADPDTATREFYINVADNPKLDTPRTTTGGAGYAVFGRVVSGMDVVDRIRAHATAPIPGNDDLQNVPIEPVVIERLRRIGGG